MPRASTPCPTPGCPNLTPCPTHKRQAWAGSNRRQTLPPDWPATRQRILTRDGHRCTATTNGQRCNAPANQVDHITRGAGDHDTNLAALCQPCHAAKSSAEGQAARYGHHTTRPR